METVGARAELQGIAAFVADAARFDKAFADMSGAARDFAKGAGSIDSVIQSIGKAAGAADNPLTRMEKSLKETGQAGTTAASGLKTADAAITDIGGDAAKAAGQVDKLDPALKGAGNAATTAGGKVRTLGADLDKGASGFGTMAKQAAGLAAGLAGAQLGIDGLRAVIGGTVGAFIDFEHQIDAVGSIANATDEQVAGLSATALQLGADTSKGATEAAGAMEILAGNGIAVEDIINGAAAAAVALSEAGGVQLATAADTVSTAMAVWGLETSELVGVVNTLSGAANVSRFGVEDMSQAIASGGGAAATAGIEFEDFSTAIAAIAPSFTSGSDAGTSMKTMLTRLSPASKEAMAAMRELGIVTEDGSNRFFDAQGNVKGMADIVQVLHDALGPLSEQQRVQALSTIFGNDALRAAAGLAKMTGAEFAAMQTTMKNTDAAEIAKQRMDNLSGSLDQLGGNLETAGIQFGQMLAPAIRAVVDILATSIGIWTGLDDETQKLILTVGLFAAGMAVVPALVTAATTALAGLRAGALLLANPLTIAGAALGAMVIGVDYLLKATTGHGLMERLFGDVQRAEAAATAMEEWALVLERAGPAADKTAIALDGLSAATSTFERDLAAAEEETASFTDILAAPAQALLGFEKGFDTVGAASKRYEERVRVLAEAMVAGGATFEQYRLAHTNLSGAARDTFDEITNYSARLRDHNLALQGAGVSTGAWGVQVGAIGANIKAQAMTTAELTAQNEMLRAKQEEIYASTDNLSGAQERQIAKIQDVINRNDALINSRSLEQGAIATSTAMVDAYGNELVDSAGKAREFGKEIDALVIQLTSANPEYLRLSAENARLQEKIDDVKGSTADLTQAQKDQIAAWEEQIAVNDRVIAGYDSNGQAIEGMRGHITSFVGESGLQKLIEGLMTTGLTTEEVTNQISLFDEGLALMEQGGATAVLAMLDNMKIELEKTPGAWEAFAKVAGPAYHAALKESVADPAALAEVQGLLNDRGLKMAEATVEGLTDGIEANLLVGNEAGVRIGNELITGIDTGTNEAINQGTKAVTQFAAGVDGAEATATTSGTGVGEAAVTGMDTGSDGAEGEGTKAGEDFSTGIDGTAGGVKTAAQGLASEVNTALSTIAAKGMGAAVGTGFAEGIASARQAVINAANSIAGSVQDIFDGLFLFGSPSRWARQRGAWITEGLALGMRQQPGYNNLSTAASSVAQQIAGSLGSMLAKELGGIVINGQGGTGGSNGTGGPGPTPSDRIQAQGLAQLATNLAGALQGAAPMNAAQIDNLFRQMTDMLAMAPLSDGANTQFLSGILAMKAEYAQSGNLPNAQVVMWLTQLAAAMKTIGGTGSGGTGPGGSGNNPSRPPTGGTGTGGGNGGGQEPPLTSTHPVKDVLASAIAALQANLASGKAMSPEAIGALINSMRWALANSGLDPEAKSTYDAQLQSMIQGYLDNGSLANADVIGWMTGLSAAIRPSFEDAFPDDPGEWPWPGVQVPDINMPTPGAPMSSTAAVFWPILRQLLEAEGIFESGYWWEDQDIRDQLEGSNFKFLIERMMQEGVYDKGSELYGQGIDLNDWDENVFEPFRDVLKETGLWEAGTWGATPEMLEAALPALRKFFEDSAFIDPEWKDKIFENFFGGDPAEALTNALADSELDLGELVDFTGKFPVFKEIATILTRVLAGFALSDADRGKLSGIGLDAKLIELLAALATTPPSAPVLDEDDILDEVFPDLPPIEDDIFDEPDGGVVPEEEHPIGEQGPVPEDADIFDEPDGGVVPDEDDIFDAPHTPPTGGPGPGQQAGELLDLLQLLDLKALLQLLELRDLRQLLDLRALLVLAPNESTSAIYANPTGPQTETRTPIVLDIHGNTFAGSPEENGVAIRDAVMDVLRAQGTEAEFQWGVAV